MMTADAHRFAVGERSLLSEISSKVSELLAHDLQRLVRWDRKRWAKGRAASPCGWPARLVLDVAERRPGM